MMTELPVGFVRCHLCGVSYVPSAEESSNHADSEHGRDFSKMELRSIIRTLAFERDALFIDLAERSGGTLAMPSSDLLYENGENSEILPERSEEGTVVAMPAPEQTLYVTINIGRQ